MITQVPTSREELKGKLIAVDLDGTLCTGRWYVEEPKPIQEMIDKVWDWYKKRAHIIIYTSRNPKYLPETQGWLIKHSVPFHGIAMQMKTSADYYIDDKNVCLPL